MKRAALLSVSNREGLLEFAKGLVELGFELLTTSGTGKYLASQGVQSTAIETYTGQKEIMDGRVKTLHPKIYAGLLARRDHPEDLRQLESEGILPIDVAAVNLYPFAANVDSGKTRDEMIELIDIGGPSMIRAASKNFKFVLPVLDPSDYPAVLDFLREPHVDDAALLLRQRLAVKVFASLAQDAVEIAAYFSRGEEAAAEASLLAGDGAGKLDQLLSPLPGVLGAVLAKAQELRYGENPHQKAAFYRPIHAGARAWEQLGGKELSYNNMLDVDSTLKILNAVGGEKHFAVIIKHLNPCGAAFAPALVGAIRKAKRCDSRSHFGGIIGCATTVTLEAAQEVRGDFAEIIIAPEYSPEALVELSKSKNLRIIRANPNQVCPQMELRSALGGMLVQEVDRVISEVSKAQIVSKRKPSAVEFGDIELAWKLVPHVRSNAVIVAREGALLAVGAGQMSRIDSTELAIMKARVHGHDLKGAVAASDAFFPFPDSVETLANVGVTAIIAPSGAKRDAEAIEMADKLGIALLFAPDRHFRH